MVKQKHFNIQINFAMYMIKTYFLCVHVFSLPIYIIGFLATYTFLTIKLQLPWQQAHHKRALTETNKLCCEEQGRASTV